MARGMAGAPFMSFPFRDVFSESGDLPLIRGRSPHSARDDGPLRLCCHAARFPGGVLGANLQVGLFRRGTIYPTTSSQRAHLYFTAIKLLNYPRSRISAERCVE